MYTCLKMKKKEARERAAFMQNGSMLLEAMVSICNVKCNPIRSFTSKELQRMTDNFGSLYQINSRELYKGFIQERPVLVQKFYRPLSFDNAEHQLIINSIVIASRISIHRNALKLIGCCLEAEIPLLVHEFAENGSLEDRLRGSNGAHWQPLSWKCRLRIAMDIANVVAYLHNAFSRPIVHRDIQPRTILLDVHNVARLYDFSLCISIPEGKSYVEDIVRGRKGYAAPEYLMTGFVTEKVDVFAFGVLLMMLLTGLCNFYDLHKSLPFDWEDRNCFDSSKINAAVDPSILQEESWPGKERQLQDFFALACRCTEKNGEDRPTMIEVGKQLSQIERSAFH